MSKATIVCGWLVTMALLGCASGGKAESTGDPVDAPASSGKQDAGTQGFLDAPTLPEDAFVPPPDAQVSQLPDAGSGLFCTDNSQCTNAGECCLTLGQPMGFCAPGTIVIGACVPIT